MALYYCKKCGRIVENFNEGRVQKCDCCGTVTEPVPEAFDGKVSYKEWQQNLRDKYVKTSPEFDPYLFEHRDEIVNQKTAELHAKLEQGRALMNGKGSSSLQCPYCHSTNVRKIGTLGRMVSVGLFGLASKKIGKTHECADCGSTW